MFVDFLMEGFARHADSRAIVWRDGLYDYSWLRARVADCECVLVDNAIAPGVTVALDADFSPTSVAMFLALTERACIVVPLSTSVDSKKPEFIETSQAQVHLTIDEQDNVAITHRGSAAEHPLYEILRQRGSPGLVLFSSGSTGKSKGAVHDLHALLQKFTVPRNRYTTVTFLLYDHIGGINTMLYTLANGGCLVTLQDRRPDAVLEAVERYGVELLPTSPTFVNLILISEAYKRHDLSSLQTVTYGTEPMPESTLKRFHAALPDIRLQQTYGLSELGILRAKSRSSDSLWVKIGGEGFETRVVEGILQIKAHSAMLGYLNAPSPFTEDGWFITGDRVETDGEYMRILGRESEMINVGGEKVHPAEVESVIQEMDNVEAVTVFGEKNAIVGNIVRAKVKLVQPEDSNDFALRLKRHCRERLKSYKVPVKVEVSSDQQYSERFKKTRQL
jgi:long-chain acyl-CoA synthetase